MELKLTISASQEVLDAINNLASALQGRVVNEVVAEVPQEVVTKKPKKVTEAKEEVKEVETAVVKPADSEITIETIRAKVQEVAQNGKRDEVKALLGEFNVSRVSDLQEADFENFMTQLIKL